MSIFSPTTLFTRRKNRTITLHDGLTGTSTDYINCDGFDHVIIDINATDTILLEIHQRVITSGNIRGQHNIYELFKNTLFPSERGNQEIGVRYIRSSGQFVIETRGITQLRIDVITNDGSLDLTYKLIQGAPTGYDDVQRISPFVQDIQVFSGEETTTESERYNIRAFRGVAIQVWGLSGESSIRVRSRIRDGVVSNEEVRVYDVQNNEWDVRIRGNGLFYLSDVATFDEIWFEIESLGDGSSLDLWAVFHTNELKPDSLSRYVSEVQQGLFRATVDEETFTVPAKNTPCVITNTDEYGHLKVTFDGGVFYLKPKEQIKVNSKIDETEITYRAIAGYCNLEIMVGDIERTPAIPPYRPEIKEYNFTVRDVYKNMVARTTSIGVRTSEDFGETFQIGSVAGFTIDESHYAHITGDRNILWWADEGNNDEVIIFRSTDGGETFTRTKDGDGNDFFTNKPLWNYGVYQFGSTIIFVEWTANLSTVRRIWKSTNDGQNWTEVHSETVGDKINHFHSVIYAGGKWLAFAGDGSNSGIFESTDGGDTWTVAVGTGDNIIADGGQKWRALGVHSVNGGDYVFWASEGSGGSGVWRAKVDDLVNAELVLSTSLWFYGMAGNGPELVAGDYLRRERRQYSSGYTTLYVSKDMGDTWEKVFILSMGDEFDGGGYYSIVGPDGEGYYYVRCTSYVGFKGPHYGFKIKP